MKQHIKKLSIGQKVKFLSAPFGPYKNLIIKEISPYYVIGKCEGKIYRVGLKLIKT